MEEVDGDGGDDDDSADCRWSSLEQMDSYFCVMLSECVLVSIY